MEKEIQGLLIEAIQEQDLYLDQPVDLSSGGDSVLYGEDGQLDSLSLITIVASMEKQILGRYGVRVQLASERDLCTEDSPFRTLSEMHEYIVERVQDKLKVGSEAS